MIICVDFDSTLVSQDRDYDDLVTPLRFVPGAKETLRSLKSAGHTIVVYSCRANLALRRDESLNPLVRAGLKSLPFDPDRIKANRLLNEARYQQMVEFVRDNLGGLVDAIDDGSCGKVSADLYVDDKGIRLGMGPGAMSWREIADEYGA